MEPVGTSAAPVLYPSLVLAVQEGCVKIGETSEKCRKNCYRIRKSVSQGRAPGTCSVLLLEGKGRHDGNL